MRTIGTVSAILNTKGQNVWTVHPDATVFEAIALMADKNVGALLVISGEKLMGILSERDYTRKVALKGKSSKETKVGEILSTSIVTVSPNQTVEECMHLMTEHRVRHLPVVENDVVRGVVSIGDLVNWTISAQGAAIEQLERYIAGQ